MPHNRKKLEEIKHAAEKLFATKPDWMTFYREILGLQGLVRRAFPSLEKMAEFEQTGTYRQIHRMVTELRKITPPKVCIEDTQVITIRIPNSMHQALRSEAYELRTKHEQTLHLQAAPVHQCRECAPGVRREETGSSLRRKRCSRMNPKHRRV